LSAPRGAAHADRVEGARLGVALAGLFVLGCPSAFGPRVPGETTWLDVGALAVEPSTETTYVLRGRTLAGEARAGTVLSITPEGVVTPLTTIASDESALVAFTAEGTLVLAARAGQTRLLRFDPASAALELERSMPVAMSWPLVSPSGHFVASGGSDPGTGAPVTLLAADTLVGSAQASEATNVSLAWLHARDVLVALISTEQGDGTSTTRLAWWDATQIEAERFATLDGIWGSPLFDLQLERGHVVTGWVVSPDDAYVAIALATPAMDGSVTDPRVRLVSLETGSARELEGVGAPLAFTADGSTLVGVREDASAPAPSSGGLVTVDVESFATDVLDVLRRDSPPFFVTSEGHWVLATVVDSTIETVLYDLESGEASPLGLDARFGQLVTRRGELWVVASGQLHRVPLASGMRAHVPLTFAPRSLNILPRHDRLVLDDADDRATLRFFDPEAERVTLTATLPTP
jgi:hypothetical protein